MGRRVGSWVGAGIKVFGGVAVVAMSTVPAHVWANPLGEQVVGGAASFNRPDAATLIVNQHSDRAVINWNDFSIGNGELTRFVQPSNTSAAFNRVVTLTPSVIEGALQANGQVWLSNPNGIMVGKGGVVNAGSFIASTHDVSTADFMNGGDLILGGNSDAAILNQGKITAQDGDVFLVARQVKNEGQLMARDGTVGMVSGTEISLQAMGKGNYKIRLMAAENRPRSEDGGQRAEGGGQEAEIVNEGVIRAANAVLEAKGSYLPMAIKNTGLIEATGIVHNADGTVTLTGGEGDILNTGVVAALKKSLDGQKETGGSVLITGKNVTADPGSVLTASGKDGGGSVQLRAADTTLLQGSIEVVGLSESAKGGQVQLLGEKVGLLEGAKVNASGGAGGGEVLVGGDYLGKNPEVPNAKAVVMAPSAEIRADATAKGDGGRVIVWSDDYTAFFGWIRALGGSGGGNGGFVETSSAGNLQAFGSVDASAAAGRPGQWLLDPGNIEITGNASTDSGFSGVNPLVFTAPSNPSNVRAADIETALNLGTSVTIQTGTGAEYTIEVKENILKDLDNAATLTLLATGGILINAKIESTSQELFMIFNADTNQNGGMYTPASPGAATVQAQLNNGAFRLGASGDLRSNGGNITVTASDISLDVGSSINTNRTLNSGGGRVAGNVELLPSISSTQIFVGTASTNFFSVDDTEISQINTGAVGALNQLTTGTITIGSRFAGTVTVDGLGTNPANQEKNISVVSGTLVQDAGAGAGIFSSGLFSVESGGSIGTTANALNFSGPRLSVKLDGTTLHVANAAAAGFSQLYVSTLGLTTSGATANGQTITGSNITYTVADNGGNTTITGFAVDGTGALEDSVAFLYENRNSGVGGGNVTIGGPVRNVQLATLGRPSEFRDLSISAPNGVINVNANVNSGGGNITVFSRDINFTLDSYLNTLMSTSVGADPTATFGNEPSYISGVLDPFLATRNQWSGAGGILRLWASGAEAGRLIEIGGAPAASSYSLSRNDTQVSLVSPNVEIGGPQAGDIYLNPIANNFFWIVTVTYGTGQDPTIFSVNYISRYFEAYFDSINTRGTPDQSDDRPVNPSNEGGGVVGVPSVAGMRVSFVSGLGGLLMYPDGDVNVAGLNVTAVNDVELNARDGSITQYARVGTSSGTGSIIPLLTGRVGRTVLDSQIGNGGNFIANLPGSRSVILGDSRTTATGFASLGNDGQVNGVTMINTGGRTYNNDPLDVPVVQIVGGEGAGAAALANVATAAGTVDVSMVNGGSSYETPPAVSFIGGGAEGAAGEATVAGGRVVTAVVPAGAGGASYTSLPVVTVTGGGVQEASARPIVADGAIAKVEPQILGLGYTSAPTVTFTDPKGTGTGAAATAFVNNLGQLTPFDVTSQGSGYTAPPTVEILGGSGSGAVARAVISGGRVTQILVSDPGSGYRAGDTIYIRITDPSGLGTGAAAQVNTGFLNALGGGSNPSGVLSPIVVNAVGTGYSSQTTVSLTSDSLRTAQLKAVLDKNPGSLNQGRVVGFEIVDAGAGYTSAPTVTVSAGRAFGNFGEFGVSTEVVDQSRGSGNIQINLGGTAQRTLTPAQLDDFSGNVTINAPVQTGDARGVQGGSVATGSILIAANGNLVANSSGGAAGFLVTGDANVVGGGAGVSAAAGSITLVGKTISNTQGSLLTANGGSSGIPVQLGVATGADSLIQGSLNATTFGATDAGQLRIYAPAPGEVNSLLGRPFNPSRPPLAPRASNDLALTGLTTLTSVTIGAREVPNQTTVVVEVGAPEGQLTLLRRAEASATAFVNDGQVTLILPNQGGQLFASAPEVIITGGGVVNAEGAASIRQGQVTEIQVTNGGQGYGVAPAITITGGGGTGATAVAVIENGVVTGVSILNKGFGYTSLPTVTIGAPSGDQATATAVSQDVIIGGFRAVGGIGSITLDNPGAGYFTAPTVTITDAQGFGSGATAVATIDSQGRVTGIEVTNPGIFYLQPVVTLTAPTGVAQATANLADGKVVSFTISNPGGGYRSVPSVILATGSADPYNLGVDLLQLSADRFNVLPDASSQILITADVAAISPYTNQRPVNLGTSAVAGSTSFSVTDLQRFNVNDLVVGRRQPDAPQVGAGALTVSAGLTSDSLRVVNGLILANTRQMSDQGGTTGLSFRNVVLDAGGQVSFTGAGNQIQYLSGIIRDSALADNASFTMSSQLRTGSGGISLPLTIGEVFTSVGFVTGKRFYQGITTQNGDIRIFADQLQQTPVVGFLDTTAGGLYQASTAQVTLAPFTAGQAISIYATTPASGSLGLRIGNTQAPGLELIRAKSLVIGSGNLRDIQLVTSGFGYIAPPTVLVNGQAGIAEAVLEQQGFTIGGTTYFQLAGIRITNPTGNYSSAPVVTIASPSLPGVAGASAQATLGAAGSISLQSSFIYNYTQYPQAPFDLVLASGSSITAQTSQVPPGATSRIQAGALTLFAAGVVSLGGANNVDQLSAILTGAGSAGNFSFTDINEIRLGQFAIPGSLSIQAGGPITQTSAGIGVVGTSTFRAGSASITLDQSRNNFQGAVSLFGGTTVITDGSALTLGTIQTGSLTATSFGALNLGLGNVAGNLSATSNGGAISQTGGLTVSGSSTINAGNAGISLTNGGNDFQGDVNLFSSGAGNQVSLQDANALWIRFLDAQGSVDLTAGSSLLFQKGSAYTGLTGTLSATAGSTLTLNDSMNSLGTTLVGANAFTAGSTFTLAGANTIVAAGASSVAVTADLVDFGNSLALKPMAITANGGISLAPYTPTRNLAIEDNTGVNDTPPAFQIRTEQLRQLESTGTVTLGNPLGSGTINIGNLGNIDLSMEDYSLAFANLSGGVSFNFQNTAHSLSLAPGRSFDFNVGTSGVFSPGIATTDITIGGSSTLKFTRAGNVGTAEAPLTANVLYLGSSTIGPGGFNLISRRNEDLVVTGPFAVATETRITLSGAGQLSFAAADQGNRFAGTVTLQSSGGGLKDVTINNTGTLSLADLTLGRNFSSTVNSGALVMGSTYAGGNFTATATGIRGGALQVPVGSTSLNARNGDLILENTGNDFGSALTILSSRNASLFVPVLDDVLLGAGNSVVNATDTFTLTTTTGQRITLLAAADPGQFYLDRAQMSNFTANTFAPTATEADLVVAGRFEFRNIPNLALNTRTTGNVDASGIGWGLDSGIIANSVSVDAAGWADVNALNSRGVAQNRIFNLGNVRTRGLGSVGVKAGNFTFINGRDLNLTGTVSAAGIADLTVAGQFYNYSGFARPFDGTTGRAKVLSFSMFGGMPNQISALAGFRPGYFFRDPGGNRVMIYAVSPLTMFGPDGTLIAGIDLSGRNAGGAQFNTFQTGANNLNWMISDFGKFNLPAVSPARLEYMLFPQRVEPETRSLPQPVMRELTRELGRPPTVREVQAREVAKRASTQLRVGAILERSSFDEDEGEPQQEARGPAPVIDGGKPQAGGASEGFGPQVGAKPESETQRAEAAPTESDPKTVQGKQPGTDLAGGLTTSARKQTDHKRDSNGPLLRSGPQRAVALRLDPADAAQIIQAEREKAEVGTAPPVAGSVR